MATIIQKYKIYGLKNFIIFSAIEIKRIIDRQILKTFSQNREDLIIEKLLTYKPKTFIDIGSNHPIKFNNTYRFYLSGSRGINIEPNQYLINQYQNLRPKDNNLNIGIGLENTIKTFYQLDPDVDSTFSQRHAQKKIKDGCKLIDKYNAKIFTLKEIFTKYFNNKQIDLLSIDTEGYDYQILQSNDWNIFRPAIICVEDNTLKTQQFLTKNHYAIKNITINNSIYINEKS